MHQSLNSWQSSMKDCLSFVSFRKMSRNPFVLLVFVLLEARKADRCALHRVLAITDRDSLWSFSWGRTWLPLVVCINLASLTVWKCNQMA
jgi:hypothetical protein